MIGGIILETLGLEITSSIFFIPNVICLFILFLFPFQKNENLNLNYSLFELIELTILYLILFVSVGGVHYLFFKNLCLLLLNILNNYVKLMKFILN